VLTTDYPVKKWDKKPGREYFKELRRVSVNQIISGGNYFTEYLPFSPAWIIWDKCNVGTDQSDAELFWTSFKTSVRIFRFMWSGMMQGSPEDGTKQQGNKKLNEKRIHQAQKPVALYRWILQNYAKPGDKLIDTHVGSASSLIVFEMEGFTKFVGFENDIDYYNDSKIRMEQWRRNRHPELFRMSMN
jgi:site-specific DNA-methyltransferase (adenine-specific)